MIPQTIYFEFHGRSFSTDAFDRYFGDRTDHFWYPQTAGTWGGTRKSIKEFKKAMKDKDEPKEMTKSISQSDEKTK